MSNDSSNGDNKSNGNEGFDYLTSGLAILIAALGSAITGGNRIEGREDNATKEMAKWTRVVGRWTRGLVIVGILTAIALGIQSWILHNQLAEIKNENRAWLAAERLIPPPPPEFQIGKPPPYKPAVISFTYTNTGKEPAFALNLILAFRSIKNVWDKPSLLSTIQDISNGKTCKEEPIDPDGSTVFPNATATVLFRLTEDQTKLALSEGQYTMVAGCLIYETNGETHWSDVCRILDPIEPPDGPGFRSVICPVHNRAE